MMNVKLLLVSSLEKVFPDEEPRAFDGRVEGLLNESVSFQAAWKTMDELPARDYVRLHIVSPIEKHLHVRRVRYVPVLFPTFPDADDNYLRKTPGLYPDALTEVEFDRFRSWSNHWEAAWITVEAGEDFPAGEYPIEIILEDMDGHRLASQTAVYRRIGARLPAQTLIRTQWFHCDALCDSYRTEMFSEDFWTACENFVRTAAKRGINCILTPIHTPPLDTRVGGERRTCQLVDIEIKDGAYSFGFEKLRRWVEMCRRAGMEYFEMAHLFTQWGAEHAPKIVARVNGEEKRIFGWDTDASGQLYEGALRREAVSGGLHDHGRALGRQPVQKRRGGASRAVQQPHPPVPRGEHPGSVDVLLHQPVQGRVQRLRRHAVRAHAHSGRAAV